MVENRPSRLYHALQQHTPAHLCKSSFSRPIIFFPSPFFSPALQTTSLALHTLPHSKLEPTRHEIVVLTAGAAQPHFPAHSFLQRRGREVQPASVFRFVDPVIESASLFFSLLSSVWELKQQKGQKRAASLGICGRIYTSLLYTTQEQMDVVFLWYATSEENKI